MSYLSPYCSSFNEIVALPNSSSYNVTAGNAFQLLNPSFVMGTFIINLPNSAGFPDGTTINILDTLHSSAVGTIVDQVTNTTYIMTGLNGFYQCQYSATLNSWFILYIPNANSGSDGSNGGDFNREINLSNSSLTASNYSVKSTDQFSLLNPAAITVTPFTLTLPNLSNYPVGYQVCLLDTLHSGVTGSIVNSTISPITLTANYLVVGGGGGGGLAGTGTSIGGSGSTSSIIGGNLTIPLALGGGSGGGGGVNPGGNGGSGGGGPGWSSLIAGGSGTSGQGNNGGSGGIDGVGAYGGAGGGGGSLSSGNNGNNGGSGGGGGAGGDGNTWSITGKTFSAGGGGSSSISTGGSGGSGGGGAGGSNGGNGIDATNSGLGLTATGFGSGGGGGSNTSSFPSGGGGGAGGFVSSDTLGTVILTSGVSYSVTVGTGGLGNIVSSSRGGNGSQGLVIISYISATQLGSGGLVTSTGSGGSTRWFHTFTSNGNFLVISTSNTSYTMANKNGYYKCILDANNNWYITYVAPGSSGTDVFPTRPIISNTTGTATNMVATLADVSTAAAAHGIQTFFNSGTFTIPVTTIYITAIGGGGGGGGSVIGTSGGGGGGSGQYVYCQKFTGLVIGTILSISLGIGGNGAASNSGAAGSNGTSTSINLQSGSGWTNISIGGGTAGLGGTGAVPNATSVGGSSGVANVGGAGGGSFMSGGGGGTNGSGYVGGVGAGGGGGYNGTSGKGGAGFALIQW